jgi:hypothetical protein
MSHFAIYLRMVWRAPLEGADYAAPVAFGTPLGSSRNRFAVSAKVWGAR